MAEKPFDADPLKVVGFLSEAIAEILRTEDSEAFLAWMHTEAPRLLPEAFEDLQHEQARKAFTSELGRALWNVVPLPGQGFRPRPLPRPERNDLCPCGSGLKYKKCCGATRLEAPDIPPFDPDVIWSLVASCLPPGRIEELAAAGKVPRTALADIAALLLDNGALDTALSLVEPLFTEPARLDERDAPALGVLIEIYDEMELLETKEREVERLDRELPAALRGVLWESLARSYAAFGEMERAWDALETARRINPANPVLIPIEVSLLLIANRAEEAGKIARTALRRSRRRKLAGLSEAALQLLQDVAEDPEGTRLATVLGDRADAVHRMEKLLGSTRDLALPAYQRIEDSGGTRLETPEELLAVEHGWMDAFAPDLEDGGEEGAEDDGELEALEPGEGEDEELDGQDWENEWESFDSDPWEEAAGDWVPYLEANPSALGVLLVLADLIDAAEHLVDEVGAPLDRTLLQPLIERALIQLNAALPEGAGDPLSPRVESNVPALELLLAAARWAGRQGDTGRQVNFLDRLLHLDPEDDSAARLTLAPVLLESGSLQRVLDLVEQFPDDPLPDLTYARVLALYRQGRTEEARAALDQAVDRFSLTATLIADAESEGWREAGRETVYTLWLDTPELMAWLREKVKP